MIKESEVKHIAELARLDLSEKEVVKMQKDLEDILGYVDLLKKVNVNNIKNDFSVSYVKNIMRNDIAISESDDVKKVIINQLPDKENKLAKVKRILN